MDMLQNIKDIIGGKIMNNTKPTRIDTGTVLAIKKKQGLVLRGEEYYLQLSYTGKN